MSDEAKIREATIDDCELIANLHMKSHEQNYPAFMPEEYFNEISIDYFMEETKKCFSCHKNKAWVVETNEGDPVGFCNAFIAGTYVEGYPGYISNLHILKSHTGIGIGKTLLSICKGYLEDDLGLEGSYLCTSMANSKARSFYEREGGKLLNLRRTAFLGDIVLNDVSYGWKK